MTQSFSARVLSGRSRSSTCFCGSPNQYATDRTVACRIPASSSDAITRSAPPAGGRGGGGRARRGGGLSKPRVGERRDRPFGAGRGSVGRRRDRLLHLGRDAPVTVRGLP